MALIKVRPSQVVTFQRARVEKKLEKREADPVFKQEREKMKTAENLEAVADDAGVEATLLEWRAREHDFRPKSARWYIALAVSVTLAAGAAVFLGNILGAIAIALVGGLIYVLAQRAPEDVRYRLMIDGVAINDRLYQFRNLEAFNIVYQPGEVKSVMIRSKKMLSPLVQMEIGKADPMKIRETLLEFLPEDLDMQEPVTDTWARRLGF